MNSKIKKLLFFFDLFLIINATSQIVYTDIVDFTGNTNGAFYNIDLNQDNTNDFKLTILTNYEFNVVNYGQNKIGISYSDPFIADMAWALDSNDTFSPIESTLQTWNDIASAANSQIFLAYNGNNLQGGMFLGETNKYLPLQLKVGADTYYGWARIDCDFPLNYFTIKDFAYNSTPNQSILAGQTSIPNGIESMAVNQKNIFLYDRTIFLQTTSTNTAFDDVLILNYCGQQIKRTNFSSIISLNELQDGIYFVVWNSQEGSFVKKIFLK